MKRLVVIALLLCGCATVGSMEQVSTSVGVSAIFRSDYDDVLSVLQPSIISVGLVIEGSRKVNDNQWIIISQSNISAWSWGEIIRVVIERTNESETTVRVHTKSKLATNITYKDNYSSLIFSEIGLRLLTLNH
ncbi:MAG: hypothetical protein V3W14_03855 [Candidatus Neomarinimicrobiota bacterium]